ncbi:unnamed protein product [Camellia sinensis]
MNGGDPPQRSSVECVLLQKLKDDLQKLPDDQGLDEFAGTPVIGFGAALFARYGWRQGRGIGRKAGKDFSIKHCGCVRAREGLGFSSCQQGYKIIKKQNRPTGWLAIQIRVRLISKDFQVGQLYLKGEVLCVSGPTTCDVFIGHDKDLIQGVEEDFLETLLPQLGGPVLVLVLYGEKKGIYGRLMEREDETAIVQDDDSLTLFKVSLNQIAEYGGEGY